MKKIKQNILSTKTDSESEDESSLRARKIKVDKKFDSEFVEGFRTKVFRNKIVLKNY